MRIVFSTSDFVPNVGGVASVVLYSAKALQRCGHEVTVLHWTRKPLPTGAGLGLPVPVVQLASPATRTWSRAVWRRQVARLIAAQSCIAQADVLHFHTACPDGFSAKYLNRNLPKLFTNHTSGFLRAMRKPLRFLRVSYRSLGAYDMVLAPSEELANLSKECGARCVEFIPNGVDEEVFRPDAIPRQQARATLGISASALVILAPRRFVMKNGLRHLAAAFGRIRSAAPDALLVFCGPDADGIELPAVREALIQSGTLQHARFEGQVLNSAMTAYYAAADVVVLPSLLEATSVSGLEAMACGLPLVGTKTGGIPAIIEHSRNGFLVETRDPAGLADAIITLLRDPALRRLMGEHGRSRVLREFSWNCVAGRLESAYESVIAGKPRV